MVQFIQNIIVQLFCLRLSVFLRLQLIRDIYGVKNISKWMFVKTDNKQNNNFLSIIFSPVSIIKTWLCRDFNLPDTTVFKSVQFYSAKKPLSVFDRDPLGRISPMEWKAAEVVRLLQWNVKIIDASRDVHWLWTSKLLPAKGRQYWGRGCWSAEKS